jgi:hypothetical protein
MGRFRCPRCGGEEGQSRWCPACGFDYETKVGAPPPTAEAAEARDRESRWLADRVGNRPPRFDEYRPLTTFARLARGWLVISIVTLALAGAAEADQALLLSETDLSSIDLDEAAASDARLAIAYALNLGALVLTAVFFMAWTQRAYKNAAALGVLDQRFGSGWAIGGWFVPVLALWRPKQIVNDIWRTSDPDAPAILPRHRWEDLPVPAFLSAWWVLWLLGNFVDRASANYGGDDATLQELRVGDVLGLGGSLLSIFAALLAIRVVAVTTRRQEARAARVGALPAPAPVTAAA